MARASISIDVLNVPELVWQTRQAMANLLREEADSEADPRIAQRLREIAAVFEVGQDARHG